MADLIDIKKVKPDLDASKQCTLLNPFNEDFTFTVNSKPFVIPAKSFLYCQEPIAHMGAIRIAEVIIKQKRSGELEDLYRRLGGKEKLAEQQQEYLSLQRKPYSLQDKETIRKMLIIDGIISGDSAEEKTAEVKNKILPATEVVKETAPVAKRGRKKVLEEALK